MHKTCQHIKYISTTALILAGILFCYLIGNAIDYDAAEPRILVQILESLPVLAAVLVISSAYLVFVNSKSPGKDSFSIAIGLILYELLQAIYDHTYIDVYDIIFIVIGYLIFLLVLFFLREMKILKNPEEDSE